MSLLNRNKEKKEIVVNELKDDDLLNIAGGVTYTPEETEEVAKAIKDLKDIKLPNA